MSRRVGNAFLVEDGPSANCELCGQFAEVRPYGTNGERICFKCGQKNKEATERAMDAVMSGVVVIDNRRKGFINDN